MLEYSRHRFDIVTDTGGDFVDTGPPISGHVVQTRYVPGTLSATTSLTLAAVDAGFTLLTIAALGAAAFNKIPKQVGLDTGGSAIGTDYFVLSNERLRLTVNQSATDTGGKTGTFYVWSVR